MEGTSDVSTQNVPTGMRGGTENIKEKLRERHIKKWLMGKTLNDIFVRINITTWVKRKKKQRNIFAWDLRLQAVRILTVIQRQSRLLIKKTAFFRINLDKWPMHFWQTKCPWMSFPFHHSPPHPLLFSKTGIEFARLNYHAWASISRPQSWCYVTRLYCTVQLNIWHKYSDGMWIYHDDRG